MQYGSGLQTSRSSFSCLLSCLYALKRFGGWRPRQYGFHPIGAVDFVGLTLIAAFLFWLFYEPVGRLFSIWLGTNSPDFSYKSVLPSSLLLRALVVVYFAATAAVVEEVMFRALPWCFFSSRDGSGSPFWRYALISSLLFGLIHWENGAHEVVSTFMLGFVACVLYVKINNIWPLIGAHFVTDVRSFW
ncbi:MAG: CPBP family intramembrane metalloprotease [Caldithrix sp.]|nr:MAG: CPBP family intramembrane metalloprotease [Caldithrix sp.]